MRNIVTKTLCTLAIAALAFPAFAGPIVLMETSQGNITLELDAEHAPKNVANFLRYVDEGFYANTVFHRVIDGFMIQGGGIDTNFAKKATHEPVVNETDNGSKNLRGTIAMARTGDPNSATAQFFINLADNQFLDFQDKTPQGWGYTVFGRVISGMDTVDKIAKLPTVTLPDGYQNVPKVPPVIKRISRIVEAAKKL